VFLGGGKIRLLLVYDNGLPLKDVDFKPNREEPSTTPIDMNELVKDAQREAEKASTKSKVG
jgi:hypothetical protein